VLGESFGGAWFNEETWELEVAASSAPAAERALSMGLNVRVVDRSLSELEMVQGNFREQAASAELWPSVFVSAGLDIQSNTVLVGYMGVNADIAREQVNLLTDSPEAITLEARESLPVLSSSIRGGNPYVNQEPPNYPYTCSIGFATVTGFFTAGHCNYSDDPVEDVNGNAMGQFVADEWPSHDYALVDINTSWSTTYEINGYTDGIVDVPAEFGGFRYPLTNATVCRTGQMTGPGNGFHCGTVSIPNDTETFYDQYQGNVTLSQVTKTNACQEGGDSGGPYIIASSDLAQGTLIGGDQGSSCPSSSYNSWFEPIEEHMTLLPDEVRTTHGSNAPDIVNPVCPDTSLQASGQYSCVTDYDSQGLTAISWDGNSPGQTGSNRYFIGSCTPGYWVTVDLDVVNSHGSDSQSFGFTCPSGP
jgi:streptogrisin C